MINILISKKEYENNNILILENTSIKINKGDKILLEGENGSGKTTTLNIIGLLDSTFRT
ncbi:ATP-binding cassette domain-containing protein [Helcococcus ovis]|uniref:ATP-binding cassette domain-containing protein n=1 Tax=Helcococcus ovis TaxID=72026 RepID=A0A4R9C2Z4_9FIRM|nr:ATP-binding cassette domain-containing protein [Helcococcus ovis]TFF63809.1 ATP-binding cassette domain-containing protein [Helcococcus ovis]TFF66579.1 ATP-binding cassette domain-containing protein [Helcococcus ovis]